MWVKTTVVGFSFDKVVMELFGVICCWCCIGWLPWPRPPDGGRGGGTGGRGGGGGGAFIVIPVPVLSSLSLCLS